MEILDVGDSDLYAPIILLYRYSSTSCLICVQLLLLDAFNALTSLYCIARYEIFTIVVKLYNKISAHIF